MNDTQLLRGGAEAEPVESKILLWMEDAHLTAASFTYEYSSVNSLQTLQSFTGVPDTPQTRIKSSFFGMGVEGFVALTEDYVALNPF